MFRGSKVEEMNNNSVDKSRTEAIAVEIREAPNNQTNIYIIVNIRIGSA